MADNLLHLPCPVDKVSDGYHTFDELYEHRNLLFLALMKSNPSISWRSKLHADGTMEDGWWIAGMDLPDGPVTYHLPERLWPLLDYTDVRSVDRAPEWDGHTPSDVLARLRAWCEAG
jgi:hypothetical protein